MLKQEIEGSDWNTTVQFTDYEFPKKGLFLIDIEGEVKEGFANDGVCTVVLHMGETDPETLLAMRGFNAEGRTSYSLTFHRPLRGEEVKDKKLWITTTTSDDENDVLEFRVLVAQLKLES